MVLVLVLLGLAGVGLFLVRGAHRLVVAFFSLCLVAALVIENLNTAVFDQTELLIAGIALLVMIGAVVRGLRFSKDEFWVAGVGLLLLLLTVLIPAFSTGVGLSDELADLPTPTPGTEQNLNQRARGIFDAVVVVIAAQTGLDERTIAQNLDDGVTVSALIAEHGGDLDIVVEEISEILTTQVQFLATEGRLTTAQAALALSQMRLIVRIGVEQDLAGSLARFEDNPLDEED